jgi:hypothetical protein
MIKHHQAQKTVSSFGQIQKKRSEPTHWKMEEREGKTSEEQSKSVCEGN